LQGDLDSQDYSENVGYELCFCEDRTYFVGESVPPLSFAGMGDVVVIGDVTVELSIVGLSCTVGALNEFGYWKIAHFG
jgi:hypothetical protein